MNRGRRTVGGVWLGVAVLVVVLGAGVVDAPLAAAASHPKFCTALATFNATRPSSRDDTVTALHRLAAASPATVRAAVTVIANEAETVDAASALAQAGGNSAETTSLTMAGATVTAAADQTCHVAVNFAGAVPSGVSRRLVNPAGWARTVCSSVASWGQTVNTAGASLVTTANGQTTVPDVRNTLSQFLTQAVTATQQLNTELGGAGIPKTPHGAEFAASVRLGVSRTLLVFVGSQPQVQSLPTDASAFQVKAQALVTKLDATGRSVEGLVRLAETQLKVPALIAVFAHEPACSGIG